MPRKGKAAPNGRNPTIVWQARRLARRLPLSTAVLLLLRRLRHFRGEGTAGVTKILVSEQAAARCAKSVAADVMPGASLMTHVGARVLAQPPTVVTADWKLLWSCSPQLQRHPSRGDAVWRAPASPKPLAGRSLYAAVDGFSYYHWLTGTLPKILLAMRAGEDISRLGHVVVNPRHKASPTGADFQAETLALLEIPMQDVIWLDRGRHYVCDELVVTSEPCTRHQTEVAPWALSLLREAFLAKAGTAPGPDRLFISRSHARRRRLVNESDLVVELTKRGFATVVLEDLPFLEQVRLFRDAKVVVGMHGAGLANLAFAAPRTTVLELVPDTWQNPCFANLAVAVGSRYHAVPARGIEPERRFASDTLVDVATATDALDRLICRG